MTIQELILHLKNMNDPELEVLVVEGDPDGPRFDIVHGEAEDCNPKSWLIIS